MVESSFPEDRIVSAPVKVDRELFGPYLDRSGRLDEAAVQLLGRRLLVTTQAGCQPAITTRVATFLVNSSSSNSGCPVRKSASV